MTSFLFGQSNVVTFYARDKEGAAITTLEASPSIWVYSERPNRDTVENETGSSAAIVGSEITSWSVSGNGYQITVPKISDPDPDAEIYRETYYLGVKYKTDAAGDINITVLPFELTRPYGYDNELNLAGSDLKKFFPQIDDYLSATQQTDAITEGILEVKADLKSDGYEYHKIHNLESLRSTVIWKTIYLMALGLTLQDQDDDGIIRVLDESKEMYPDKLSKLPIEYDTDEDGEEDLTVSPRRVAFQRV